MQAMKQDLVREGTVIIVKIVVFQEQIIQLLYLKDDIPITCICNNLHAVLD